MSDFEIRVIRHRYEEEREYGRRVVTSDEVVLDVDEMGRAKVPTTKPLSRVQIIGGTICYAGWKRLTGIPLNPNKVYTVKFSSNQVGDGVWPPQDPINEDLVSPDELVARETEINKVAKEYEERLRKARADQRAKEKPVE